MEPRIYKFDSEKEYYYSDEGCHIIELSNAPGDPDVSIARARVEPGKSTRWHCLKGISERYVVLEGKGAVEVGGKPSCEVGPGDVVLIPPMIRQRITNTGASDLVFIAICSPRFTPEAYESL
jgi:mannose-6-phosphate isomerase-like protein (cupin superfamily)